MKNVKRIIRESRDGIKLSRDDEMFIVRNVLMHYPEKEKKMASQGNYIMVAKHQTFHSPSTWLVSSENSTVDKVQSKSPCSISSVSREERHVLGASLLFERAYQNATTGVILLCDTNIEFIVLFFFVNGAECSFATVVQL